MPACQTTAAPASGVPAPLPTPPASVRPLAVAAAAPEPLAAPGVVSAPLGFGLEQSALDAIGSWRFAPARYGERPVAVYYRWNILFSLR